MTIKINNYISADIYLGNDDDDDEYSSSSSDNESGDDYYDPFEWLALAFEEEYDYHLLMNSPAVDADVPPGFMLALIEEFDDDDDDFIFDDDDDDDDNDSGYESNLTSYSF